MARTIEVKLWDDLADEPRTVEATHTITVGLDGRWAELDLTAENHKRIHAQIAALIEKGHEPGAPPNGKTVPSGGSKAAPNGKASGRQAAIQWWTGCRDYARQNGFTVSPKGYVPALAREQYALIAGPQPKWWRKEDK